MKFTKPATGSAYPGAAVQPGMSKAGALGIKPKGAGEGGQSFAKAAGSGMTPKAVGAGQQQNWGAGMKGGMKGCNPMAAMAGKGMKGGPMWGGGPAGNLAAMWKASGMGGMMGGWGW